MPRLQSSTLKAKTKTKEFGLKENGPRPKLNIHTPGQKEEDNTVLHG